MTGAAVIAVVVLLIVIERRLGKIQEYLRVLVARSEPDDEDQGLGL